MNILITGTSGFIASKLAKELKAQGYNVIGLDFSDKGEHTSIVLDISSKSFIDDFPLQDIDVIYHLAAQSGGYRSLVDPYIDAEWNSTGTANVVNLAKKLNINKFIYTSTMAVYGNSKLVTEDTPVNPISFYGVSKYAGELQTKLLKEHSDISYTIYRLFATYGAGQDLENSHQGILSIYLSQALKANTVNITGKKDRVRELIHVDDVVQALLLGLDTRTDDQVYNVTNNETITPEIIINEIAQQTNKEIAINELDGYVGDQTFINSKKSKLYSLGWSPKINLKQGVQEFLSNI